MRRVAARCEAVRQASRPPRGWGDFLYTALPLAALALALTIPQARAQNTYKWVDEKGVVHYTDKMPPEMINKGATVLDKQARPIKKVDPAPTPEQRAAKEAEEERQKQLARERDVAERKNRALLHSYTSESEIDLAKHRALGTLDTQIASAEGYIVQLDKRKKEAEARKAQLGDKPVPEQLERELMTIDIEHAKQASLISQKKQEKSTITARYDADKQRWRELRAVADANAAATADARAKAGTPTAK